MTIKKETLTMLITYLCVSFYETVIQKDLRFFDVRGRGVLGDVQQGIVVDHLVCSLLLDHEKVQIGMKTLKVKKSKQIRDGNF